MKIKENYQKKSKIELLKLVKLFIIKKMRKLKKEKIVNYYKNNLRNFKAALGCTLINALTSSVVPSVVNSRPLKA